MTGKGTGNGSEKRRRARRAGLRAETAAVWFLRCKGYRIEAKNLRTPLGEIDIAARRGGTLAIVEVKRRADAADLGSAVTAAQQRRLVNAAGWLLSARPALARLTVRFDVVLVAPGRLPLHLPNAWQA
ncbi:MAG: YraN family protein [Rhodospirillaceae bacterium]|nr:YraN family protein [Rhodospirillaceae bacterium]